MNAVGGSGRDVALRERHVRENYGIRLPRPNHSSRLGGRVDPSASTVKRRLIKRCRNANWLGHADRFDHDFYYRHGCLERDIPRVLHEIDEEKNEAVVYELQYFQESCTPVSCVFMYPRVGRSVKPEFMEVCNVVYSDKYFGLLKVDASLESVASFVSAPSEPRNP